MTEKGEDITIVIAEDHPLMRSALRDALAQEQDFKIVGEAQDGEDAIRLAEELHPRIVIMDIAMPKLNGLEATRRIKAGHPEIAIVILTVYDDSEHVLEMLGAGASAYLTKSVFGEEVIQAVRGVSAGDTVLSPSVSQQLVKYAMRSKTKPVQVDAVDTLSAREIEIIRMAARGISNKDIAANLELSERTVKGALVNIFSKLKARSRTEAVFICLKAGFITMEDLG